MVVKISELPSGQNISAASGTITLNKANIGNSTPETGTFTDATINTSLTLGTNSTIEIQDGTLFTVPNKAGSLWQIYNPNSKTLETVINFDSSLGHLTIQAPDRAQSGFLILNNAVLQSPWLQDDFDLKSYNIINGFMDNVVIGDDTPAAGTFTTITGTTITFSDLVGKNGSAIRTSKLNADQYYIQAFDVDNNGYRTFATLTAGNAPSLAIAAPFNGTVTIDGATIGGTTPADGSFNTVNVSTITMDAGGGFINVPSSSTTILQIYNPYSTQLETAMTFDGTAGKLYIKPPGVSTNGKLYIQNANITGDSIDGAVIGASDPQEGTFTNINLTNGGALKTDTTIGHTALIQAYDVDGAAYKTFGTLTNGNTPSLALAAPSGGTVTIDGAVIGGITPANGTFSGLTVVAGVLNFLNGGIIVSGPGTSTNATPFTLLALTVAQNTGYTFKGSVTGTKSDGSAVVGGSFEIVIRRASGGNVTEIPGTTTTIISDAGFAATFAVSANVAAQAFLITGTGVAATNINWVYSITRT